MSFHRLLALALILAPAPVLALPGLAAPLDQEEAEKERGYLGIYVDDTEGGVRISGVIDGHAGEAAGLQEGDRIVSLGGRSVGSIASLGEILEDHPPGSYAPIVVRRGDEEVVLTMGIGSRSGKMTRLAPEPPAPPASPTPSGTRTGGYIGIYVDDSGAGVLVSGVIEGQPGERAGLRAGDRLLRVAGEGVDSLQELGNVLEDYAPGKEVSLVVLRNGEDLELPVRLASREAASAAHAASEGRGRQQAGNEERARPRNLDENRWKDLERALEGIHEAPRVERFGPAFGDAGEREVGLRDFEDRMHAWNAQHEERMAAMREQMEEMERAHRARMEEFERSFRERFSRGEDQRRRRTAEREASAFDGEADLDRVRGGLKELRGELGTLRDEIRELRNALREIGSGR